MRARMSLIYWSVAGAILGFGLIGLMTIGFPFLIVGMILCIVGVWKPGIGRSWAFLIGFGGLPALVFLRHIIAAALTAMNPYCSGDLRSGRIVAPPGAGTVSCANVPASYYMMFVISVAITLSGVVVYLLLRARSGDGAPA